MSQENTDSRKNIKCEPGTFSRLQELKNESSSSNWDEFLHGLADMYETYLQEGELDVEGGGDLSNEELYSRIEELLLQKNPKKTADVLESRLR